MKRYTLIFLLLTTFGTAVSAQDSILSSQTTRYKFQLDSTTIMLGDQTVLAIEPATLYPTLEELTNNDIVAVRQWTDSTNGNFCTALTSFEEGEHWLHVGLDSVLITVKDVPNVDTTNTNIRDIANILRQPYTFGEIAKVVSQLFDLRPKAIEDRLKLRNPIYEETAAYGHMGREPKTVVKRFRSIYEGDKDVEVELFTWEKLDYVDKVKRAFGL